MARSSKILKIGITVLIFSLLCLEPAMADVTPVNNISGNQIGSISYTLIPDKAAYSAGDVITYIFQIGLACCDPTSSFVIDHLLSLAITLDPHITDISSNADYWLTGGGDGITGNSGFFYDSVALMAWGFAFPPATYLIPKDDWPHGPALMVSGIISPGTPPWTKITTHSYIAIVNDGTNGQLEHPYTGADDTSVVMVTPEYPSPALPAAMILGLIGTVFVVRSRKK